ncbi:MAG TPA: serine/threonine-protein kinase, partial [Polyangiaceae bacterium LLY-WYZ-15_(1-7)]|nr:serine/threonine-protein kinase [Polyangiaceae bacterium LLY-WYZ-15_(1-7)]
MAELTTEALEAHARTLSAHRESFVHAPGETIRPAGSAAAAEQEALAWLARFEASRGDALSLGERLGSGGMGVVREARQEALGRAVAVKTLRADMRDPAHVVRLLREAWITGALEHPNVIPVHALTVDGEGAPQVVLKKVEGEPWSSLLADPERLPTEAARRDPLDWHLGVLRSVCNALAFAHSRGILHRDVKPENVLVGPFGEVYLADWGIAVGLPGRVGGRIPTQAESDALAGTPAYMAPEMVRGAPVDERTDVYLLGATLHEILAGAPPHAGQGMLAMLGSILTTVPEPPPGAPPELAEVCRRALDPEPAERFPSVDAFAEALDAFRAHRVASRLAEEADARLQEL